MKEFVCACGKSYDHKQSLSKHGKNCKKYIERKNNNLPLNLPAVDRNKFILDQYVNKEGTTIINDYSKNDYSTTNHTINNDNSITNNITNNYTLKVDYLNPITAYETNHMNPDDTWKIYNENCGETGIGCLIDKLFENDTNKNIKLHDDEKYLVYMVKDDASKLREHPPKYREMDKGELYGIIVEQIFRKCNLLEISRRDENWNKPRINNYVARIMNEELNNAQSSRKKYSIEELDKIADKCSRLIIEKKNIFLHEEGYYDTDTLSE